MSRPDGIQPISLSDVDAVYLRLIPSIKQLFIFFLYKYFWHQYNENFLCAVKEIKKESKLERNKDSQGVFCLESVVSVWFSLVPGSVSLKSIERYI